MTERACVRVAMAWGRNITDLLNELRVAGTGIQVMFAFLLIAPSVHHRLLFRQRERAYLVRVGTRLAIMAAAFLAVGFTGILVLISNFVFGTLEAVCVGIAAAILVTSVWFAMPLGRRHECSDDPLEGG